MGSTVTTKTMNILEKSTPAHFISMIFIAFEFDSTELMINAIEQIDQANEQTQAIALNSIHLNSYTGHLHHLFIYTYRQRDFTNFFHMHRWFAMDDDGIMQQ